MTDPRKTHRFIDETDTAMCGTRIESYPIDYSEPGRVTCLTCRRMMEKKYVGVDIGPDGVTTATFTKGFDGSINLSSLEVNKKPFKSPPSLADKVEAYHKAQIEKGRKAVENILRKKVHDGVRLMPVKSPSSYPLGGSMPYGDAPCPKPILCGNTYRDWPPFTRPKNHYGEHTSDLSTTTHCTWGNHDQPLHLRLIDKMKEILRVR